MKKKNVCKSCDGPLDEFDEKDLIRPGFCPYCVNKKGELKSYKEILDGMIEYITQDHPEVKPSKREKQAVEWLREGQIWGEKFRGIVIDESLRSKNILKIVHVAKTRVSQNNNQKTHAGYSKWHLYYIMFFRTELENVLKILKKDLKIGWFADVSGKIDHFIIFKGKVFHATKGKRESYKDAIFYGKSVGITDKQLNFKE